MTVKNNIAANHALSYVNENSRATVKSLNKIASGMKITSAGEDPANFSISERMRVKLRALDQNTRNVQHGRGILDTAGDGIARQIDLLRTIRAKVVESANDSVTDEDRQTIQKEINQYYEQMELTAYDTKYNSMNLLIANSKILSDEAQAIDRTALNLIPDEYSMLDGVNGPFDVFSEYSSTTKTLGTTTGYVAGSSSTVATMDFSGYNNVSDLNNVGITVDGTRYVITDDTSKTYHYVSNSNEIALGSTVDETINNIVSKFSRYGATRDGNKIQMNTSLGRTSDSGGDITTYAQVPHTGTGAGISGTTSGGVTNVTGDTDIPAAAKATLTVDLSGVTSNTGFRFSNVNFRVLDSGADAEGTVDRTLTKGSTSSGAAGYYFSYTFDGNNLTFTANSVGANYNGYSIVNSYNYYTNGTPTTTSYAAYSAFSGTIDSVTNNTPSTPGSWSLDLSGKTVDDFSAEYAGKTLYFNGTYRKFYDSAIAPKLEGTLEDSGSRASARTQVDINNIRQAVNNGTSLAQAVRDSLGISSTSVDGDSVKFTSYSNSTRINLIEENLRHYDIDFSGLDVNFPNALYGKGFRAYCATDNREWFNFVFTDGTNNFTTDIDNVKPININVSKVKNATRLVQEIYEQANPILTGDDPKYNHHLRLAADLDNKTLTIYDHRRFDVSQAPYVYQELGAKIADGVLLADDMDNRDYWIKDLVIQDTDSADMNIRIKIPQMTLDQLFNLANSDKTIYDYSVTDTEIRDALLGINNKTGILDNGLKYLLDAAVSVGAQSKRLESTLENISTESENLSASESVIRDADIAKEMTAFVKHNILTQSSQALLSHANQVQAMIIPLLTGKEETA